MFVKSLKNQESMNKSYFPVLALCLLSSLSSVGQTTNSSPYCMPVFGGATVTRGITSVNYGSGTNASAPTNNSYTFYNNLPANPVTGGQTFCFFSVNAIGGAGDLTLYVDWNQDNVFEQTIPAPNVNGERVYTTSLQAGGSISLCSPAISDTTMAGTTRARIMYVTAIVPCSSSTATPLNGEVEDYLVTVSGVKPIPRVTSASTLTGNSATLGGTVHANGGGATTVDFEYGQTTSYTNSVTGGSVSANAHTTVSANITGLLPNTIYHYRVKSTNTNGTTYSKDQTFVTTSLGVAGVDGGAQFFVSPNPSNGAVRISGIEKGRDYEIAVYDLTGRKVLATSLAADGWLHLEELTKGVYMLRIKESGNADAVFATSRVVLN